MINIVKLLPNDIYIVTKECKVIDQIYETPCSSDMLLMFLVSEDNCLNEFNISEIMFKMWAIPKCENKYYVIPLCHN